MDCEFDAPKFYDFLSKEQNEVDDKWFDERPGDEGGIDMDLAPFYNEQVNSYNAGFEKATNAITAALKEEPSDIRFLSEKENVKMSSVTNKTDRISQIEINETIKEEKVGQFNGQDNKKNDMSDSLPRRNQPIREVKSRSIDYSDTRKRKSFKNSATNTSVSTKKAKFDINPDVTCSEIPSFIRKQQLQGIKNNQSTEELELNRIKELQKQTLAKLKRNGKSLKKAIKPSIIPNRIISEQEVTKPKEFNFATDNRIKYQTIHTQFESNKPFENQLRMHPKSPNFKNCPTKPKPFHFNVADKPTFAAAQPKVWESMALSTLTFQTKTPDRFRARLKKEDHCGSFNHDNKKKYPIITNPKTPQLMTKGRSRPVTVVSANDIEDKQVEEMKSYKFKATKFNPKIIEKGGFYGVKQIPAAEATSAKPFHFGTDDRLNFRKQKQGENFQAGEGLNRETNTKIYSDEKSSNKSQEESLKPKKTNVKPFSFEKRDKERYHKKEEKIKEIIKEEEKLREFHAKPLPLFSPEDLPVVESKKATNPEPFHISTGSVAYQQKLKQELEQQMKELKAKRNFKARSNFVSKKEPFKPLTGNIPPTQPEDVTLNSEIRAKERAKFEEWKHKQELILEEAKLFANLENEKEEEQLIKQLRKEAIPKAQGIHHYKRVEIKKGLISITEPKTPNFETKKRAMKKFI